MVWSGKGVSRAEGKCSRGEQGGGGFGEGSKGEVGQVPGASDPGDSSKSVV